MAKCEHCNADGCTYPDHGNGESNDPHTPLGRAELFLALSDSEDTIARLRHQRAVLRREVRRLNAKIAALTAVVAAWRSADGWYAVRAMAAKPIIDGPLWELRKAIGLTACEVSNEDVIRAAARRLGKREEK